MDNKTTLSLYLFLNLLEGNQVGEGELMQVPLNTEIPDLRQIWP